MRSLPRLAVLCVLVVGAVLAPAPVAAAPGDEIRFSSPIFSVNEEDRSVTVSIDRSGALLVGRSTVDYATVSGSAVPSDDYVDVSGRLVFDVGERTKSFKVPIRDDQVAEPLEDIGLILDHGDSGTSGVGSATIFITDEDGTGASATPAPVNQATSGPAKAGAPAASTAAPSARRPLPPRAQDRDAAAQRRHRLAYRPGPATALELRPPTAPDSSRLAVAPPAVDPLLALLAGLLLARVAAQVWFRVRVDS